jgi:hypothetical protein
MVDYLDRPLIEYLPNVLKEVREFQALMFAEQPEIFGAYEGIDNALQNEFVVTATEYGIRRWEKILSIIPNPAAESLEFRRTRILLRLQTYLPFTERWLKGKLDELFGASNVTFSIDYNRYKINASINQVDMNLMNEVKLLFKKVVPANMNAIANWNMRKEAAISVGAYADVNRRIKIYPKIQREHSVNGTAYTGILAKINSRIKIYTRGAE